MSKDDDLRWRLQLLQEALDEGKVSFAEHLANDMRASLMAVRTGDDGLIDLDTVDGRVRAMALAIAGFRQRDEAKALISLKEIQQRYFDLVEHTFGDFYD